MRLWGLFVVVFFKREYHEMLHHHYILNIRDLLHCDSISSTTLNGHEKDDKDTQKEHSQMKYLKVFLQLQIKKKLLHIF